LLQTAAVHARRAASVRAARPAPLSTLVSAAEWAAHTAFVAGLGANAVWRRYLAEKTES